MNVLFLTIAWPQKGKRNLYSDLIDEFVQNGHDVTVVTSQERRTGKDSSFEVEQGIEVLRIKTGNISKTNPLEKSISLLLLGWQLKRGINKHLGDADFDLILFNTPPITLSGLIDYLKDKYQSSVYLLLKDIWPYGFADFGLIKKGGWIYNYFRKHEKKLYELSDVIGCMSPKGVEFVENLYPDLANSGTTVEVCPNSAKLQNGTATKKPADNSIRTKFGIPEDATVFIFSGNIALGHGIDFLSDAVKDLRDYEKAFFLIGGGGTYFDRVKETLGNENVPNALVYSYLPQDEYEALISICDVGLILLDHQYSYPQFPSRLLSYLQNQMAVLCAVNEETDIGEIVQEHGAGLEIRHGDIDGFTKAVKYLSENRQELQSMGKNAYSLLESKYQTSYSYQTIIKHFERELQT